MKLVGRGMANKTEIDGDCKAPDMRPSIFGKCDDRKVNIWYIH